MAIGLINGRIFITMLLIGAKIQEYRKNAGLSQEEFAAKIGVTRQAVSKWELDKAYPDLDKLAGICDIFQISITEFIYGEMPEACGQSDGKEAEKSIPPNGEVSKKDKTPEKEVPEIKMISAGKVRGKGAYLRLCTMFVLLGGLFLFCGVLFVTTVFHHAWKKDDGRVERVRVERVYQQYTKADLSFFDDVSRRVVKTVWLDVDGIREGDFIACYTDEGQRGIYYEYHARTPIVLAVVTGGFLMLFILCTLELRRLVKENGWYIRADGTKQRVNAGEEEPADKQAEGRE